MTTTDTQTPDLFTPEDLASGSLLVSAKERDAFFKGEPPFIHDTCEISAIYMQKHSYMSGVSLGQWFNRAHELGDDELINAVTALEAKRLIVRKGYNRLPLITLEQYNAGIGKGERK